MEKHIGTRRRSYLFQLTSYISFPSTKSLLASSLLRTVWNAEIESNALRRALRNERRDEAPFCTRRVRNAIGALDAKRA